VAAATLEAARQRREQARYALEAGTLRARIAGRVLERHAQPGDAVAPRTPIVTLRPDRPLIVRAELNEALVAKVKPGMRAEVVGVADERSVHAAQVLRIGERFGATRLTAEGQDSTDERSVECILRLDSNTLRLGQRVLVRFLP
jgi:membrane fusion protein, macrolide-specific efflux system